MSHSPSVRALPIGWTSDEPPRITEWQEGPWELVCADCGDDLGPLERQTEAIRAVRGPYLDREAAKRAMLSHVQNT